MRPCRATRAGTQAPPLPNSIIFFHAIPYKQNSVHAQFTPNEINRPCAICPNTILHSHAICPNETVGAVPVCPPERPRSGVSILKHCVRGMNDGCAPAGRHGRAHRHRPYQTPLYIRVQSSPTTSTTQTKRVNNPHTHRGRKCIAHSRPHYLK